MNHSLHHLRINLPPPRLLFMPALFITVLFIATLFIAKLAHAEIALPALTARVTDLTGTLTAQQKAALEQRLQAFETGKGSQIAVLMVPTTEPETIEQFGLRVAEQWKLGRTEVDDGVLLLIARDDRTLRIESGYGLEGALNDATAKRIIAEIITPRFKADDYFGGIEAGVTAIIKVVEGEPLPAPVPVREPKSTAAGSITQLFPIVFLLAFMVAPLLRGMIGRFPASLATGGIATAVIWFFMGSLIIAALVGIVMLVISLFSGSNTGRGGLGRGGYFGGGLGGIGGGGGGGFGGGGGGFGGGGASGRW